MTDYDDEQFVSQAFSSLSQVKVSSDLSRRVAQIPIDHEKKAFWPWGHAFRPAFALFASGVMGLFLGLYLDVPEQGVLPSREIAVAFDAGEGDPSSETAKDNMDNTDEMDEVLDLFAVALGVSWGEDGFYDEEWALIFDQDGTLSDEEKEALQ